MHSVFFSLANNIFIGISSSTRRLKYLAVFRFTLLLLRHLAPVSTLLVSRCRSYIYLSPIARLTCLEVHLAEEKENTESHSRAVRMRANETSVVV